MNIKYRLLCKRLIEERKRVGVIQYYNVLFIMELLSDKDIWFLEQWANGINNIYMKDIHNWCRMHFVKYHTVFVYRKEYPVKANIWNGYSYIRLRMERMWKLRAVSIFASFVLWQITAFFHAQKKSIIDLIDFFCKNFL